MSGQGSFVSGNPDRFDAFTGVFRVKGLKGFSTALDLFTGRRCVQGLGLRI